MLKLLKKLPKMLLLWLKKINRELLMKEIVLRKRSKRRKRESKDLLKNVRSPKKPNRLLLLQPRQLRRRHKKLRLLLIKQPRKLRMMLNKLKPK